MNINQRIEQIEKELQELKEQVANQEQAKNKTPIGWVPGDGENYYFVYYDGDIKFQINNTEWDKTIVKYTKVFKTEEEAEFHAKKMKVTCELDKFAREFVYGGKSWTIAWNYYNKIIVYTFDTGIKNNLIYFESKEKAQEAIQTVGEDRVKKYYLEVE